MRKLLFLLFVVFIGIIINCGSGGDSNSEIKSNDENNQTSGTVTPETSPQLVSYTRILTVKLIDNSEDLTKFQASDERVYYKKWGDYQYTPCDKKSENTYVCKIHFYKYELYQNVRIIFTYNFKLFNEEGLKDIYIEDTPEVIVSKYTTENLKEKGIIKNVNGILIIRFPNNDANQPVFLNISGCTYTGT
jgi:hypothetical protein